MNELERYKNAVDAAEYALREVQNMENREAIIHHAQDTLIYIDKLLNPPPVYEEVELVKWAAYHSRDNGLIATFDTEDRANNAIRDVAGYVVKLTGTRRVEKPQPRERSVSVDASIDQGGVPYGDRYVIEFPQTECHGKTGVLTFTWQE